MAERAETIEELIASVRELRADYDRVLSVSRRLIAQRHEIAEWIRRWAHGDSELPPANTFFPVADRPATKANETSQDLVDSVRQLCAEYDFGLKLRKGILGEMQKIAADAQSILQRRRQSRQVNREVTLPAA